jgi:hypothetical protein
MLDGLNLTTHCTAAIALPCGAGPAGTAGPAPRLTEKGV